MKTTREELIKMGYVEEKIDMLFAMSPGERMACLNICGNAWQDMPLFETIAEVCGNPNASVDLKRAALTKSYLVVGMDPKLNLTDEEVLVEAEKYAKGAEE